MKRSLSILGFACALALTACFGGNAPVDNTVSSSAASSTPEVMEDVTYRGTVARAGISIYMEGTHRLILAGGDFLLLESDTLALDDYVDQEVSVRGDVRSTVEAGGMIMNVSEIALVETSSEAASSDTSSEASSVAELSSSSDAVSSRSSAVPATSSASSTMPSSAASSVPVSDALNERTKAMAKDDTSAGSWTQEYCSSHIGFCIPVHKNWWFKSFGTTTSYLWHVELSSEEIVNLGDGPLVVNLVSGSVASKAADKEVKTQGAFVVGYRAWTDNRHFEISAPASLQAAVTHITQNLTASTPAP